MRLLFDDVAMDGEKDPRVLFLAFTHICVIVKNFEGWQRFVEEIFEITSCYFPITFRNRPEDPGSITQEQLQGKLRFPRYG